MEIDKEKLLIFMTYNEMLLSHIEDVAETVLSGAYDDIEELNDDMRFALKSLNVIREKKKYILNSLGIK